MLARLLPPPSRFVLAIGNEGALLLHLAGGRIRERWQVAGLDETAFATLRTALASAPRRPVVVVSDLLEQAYRKETLPKLNRIDRARVLARRLERAFPGAPLRAARLLGTDPEDPRQQRCLLIGTPPAADWDRWLAFLRTVENPITALTLLPIEATDLVGRLVRALTPADRRPHGWAVLVSRQRTGGFRQIAVHQGELALTRLTPSLPADATPAVVAEAIRQELRATLGYLTRLGYRAGTSLDIVVLGDDALRDAFADAGVPGVVRVVSAAAAARALRLSGVAADGEADGSLIAAIWAGSRRRPVLRLLPRDLHARMVQGLTLRWASAALAGSAVALISYSALSAVSALQVEQEIDWLSAWQSTARQQLERAGSRAAQISDEAARVRAALEAHRRLTADRPDPVATLAVLGRTLAPATQLRALHWRLAEPERAGRAAPPSDGGDFVLDLTIDLGRFRDPAAAVSTTEAAARALEQAFPDRPVTIVRQAVDILPHQAFSGAAGADVAATAEPMSAELQIGRRR